MWKLLRAAVPICGSAMIVGAEVGPNDAEINLCRWTGKLIDGLPDHCLGGLDGHLIKAIAIAVVVGGSLWAVWPWLRQRKPQTMILIGLLVAGIGIVIAGVGALKQGRAAAPVVPTPTVSNPSKPSGPAKHHELIGTLPPRYTAYEKAQRLKAIDEIYGIITSEVSPAFTEGQSILADFQCSSSAHCSRIDKVMQARLLDHSKNVKVAFGDLESLLKKYEYYPDIVAVAKQNPYNGLTEINASTNLADEIDFWPRVFNPNGGFSPRDVWNRDMILFEFSNANRDFGSYVADTLPRLQQKRAEIEAAGVYTGP